MCLVESRDPIARTATSVYDHRWLVECEVFGDRVRVGWLETKTGIEIFFDPSDVGRFFIDNLSNFIDKLLRFNFSRRQGGLCLD